MLKINENKAQVVENWDDSIVIFETENENEIKALAQINHMNAKSMDYFERSQEETDMQSYYENWSFEYSGKVKAMLEMFNLLTDAGLSSYMFV